MLKKAEVRLAESKTLYRDEYYEGSINRSYYAILLAASALLAAKDLNAKTHSGTIKLINLHFVKTGLLSKEMAGVVVKAKKSRESSDYNVYYEAGEEEAGNQLVNAARFIEEVERIINVTPNAGDTNGVQ